MIKDPQDVLRHDFSWESYLDDGEEIASYEVHVDSGDVEVDSSTQTEARVRAFVSGGSDGTLAQVTAHIVTSTGRESDQTLMIVVQQPVDYQAVATLIIRRLTGSRWMWPPMQVRDLFDVPPGTRFLQLRAEPVLLVVSVDDYKSGDPIEFERMGSNRIELLDGKCSKRRRVDVTYNFGNAPSGLVRLAIRVLADELGKADNDDAGCRIPERVTSVTRQGISWTLIDPMDFIDKGRTGIVEVDMAINAANLTVGRARPRVWSPEFPVPERLSATQLPLPGSPTTPPGFVDPITGDGPPSAPGEDGQEYLDLESGNVYSWSD